MSDSISRIYDDYDDYEGICKHLKIECYDIHSQYNPGNKSFYKHLEEILKDHNSSNTYEFWAKQKT